MWCTVINGGILILWASFSMLAPDLVYRTQNFCFPIPRETFNVLMYSFIGIFKIFFLLFNAVPYIALLLIG